MPNRIRTHLVGDTSMTPKMAPAHLTKQQFGKRLYEQMLKKGWTQSELGRQADLPRDSISVYIRGRSLPTPASLKKLADALGVEETELLPNYVESAIDDDTPMLEMKISPNAPNTAWLRVNRLVTVATAMKVLQLLEADDATEAGK